MPHGAGDAARRQGDVPMRAATFVFHHFQAGADKAARVGVIFDRPAGQHRQLAGIIHSFPGVALVDADVTDLQPQHQGHGLGCKALHPRPIA